MIPLWQIGSFKVRKLLYVVLLILLLPFLSCTSHHINELSDSAIKQISDSLKYYSRIGEASRFTDTEKERKFACHVIRLAEKINDPHWLSVGYSMKGGSYNQNYIDSTYFYYHTSLLIAQKNNLPDDEANALYSIGWLNMNVFNYKNAIIFIDSGIRIVEKTKNYFLLSTFFNSLGEVMSDMNDRAGAKNAYLTSYKFAILSGNKAREAISYANLEPFENDTTVKLKILFKSLKTLLEFKDGQEQELATIYHNIANFQKNQDSALFYLNAALKVMANAENIQVKAAINNTLVYVYLDKGDLKKAAECLTKESIPELERSENYDWLTTLYDSYGDVLKASGRYEEAITWKEKSVQAKVKADKKSANSQVRLLSSLLDLKNKEKQILVQHDRVQKITLSLIIAGLVIIILCFAIFWMIQRSRARFQKQQFLSAKRFIELEENEKDRTARDLHDITGKFILNISNVIENIDFPDDEVKNELIEKVEDIGDSLRQISHRLNKTMVEKLGFDELIYGYCEDFYNISGLPIEVEMPKNEYNLPGEIVLHVYRITQELLSNASKYAKEGMVELTIKVDEKKLELSYRDTGPGLVVEEVTGNGMGFMNIYERVKLLGGKAKLVSSPGNGLEWEILIPYINKFQKAS